MNRKWIKWNAPNVENFVLLAAAMAAIAFRFSEEHATQISKHQKFAPKLDEIKENLEENQGME
jgi:hypothetical protein